MTRWTLPKDPTFKGQAVGHTQMGISPQFLSNYRKNARRLLDEGLQRGDWRVVTLMDMAINKRHGQLIDVDLNRVRRMAYESRDYVVEKSGFTLPAI